MDPGDATKAATKSKINNPNDRDSSNPNTTCICCFPKGNNGHGKLDRKRKRSTSSNHKEAVGSPNKKTIILSKLPLFTDRTTIVSDTNTGTDASHKPEVNQDISSLKDQSDSNVSHQIVGTRDGSRASVTTNDSIDSRAQNHNPRNIVEVTEVTPANHIIGKEAQLPLCNQSPDESRETMKTAIPKLPAVRGLTHSQQLTQRNKSDIPGLVAVQSTDQGQPRITNSTVCDLGSDPADEATPVECTPDINDVRHVNTVRGWQGDDNSGGPQTGESPFSQGYTHVADQPLGSMLVVHHAQGLLQSQPQDREPRGNTGLSQGEDIEPPHIKTVIASKIRQLTNKPKEAFTSKSDTSQKTQDIKLPQSINITYSKPPQAKIRSTLPSLSNRGSDSLKQALGDSIEKQDTTSYDGQPVPHVSHGVITPNHGSSVTVISASSYDSGVYVFDPQELAEKLQKPASDQHSRVAVKPIETSQHYQRKDKISSSIRGSVVSCDIVRRLTPKANSEGGRKGSEALKQNNKINQPETVVHKQGNIQHQAPPRQQDREQWGNTDPREGEDIEPTHRKTIIASKLRQLSNKPKDAFTLKSDTSHKTKHLERPQSINTISPKSRKTTGRSTPTSSSNSTSDSWNQVLDDEVGKRDTTSYDGKPTSHVSHDVITSNNGPSAFISTGSHDSGVYTFNAHESGERLPKPASKQHSRQVRKCTGTAQEYKLNHKPPLSNGVSPISCDNIKRLITKGTSESGRKGSDVFAQHNNSNQVDNVAVLQHLDVQEQAQELLRSQPQMKDPRGSIGPSQGEDIEPPHKKTIIVSKLRQFRNKPRQASTLTSNSSHKAHDIDHPEGITTLSSKPRQTTAGSTLTFLSDRNSDSRNEALDDSNEKQDTTRYHSMPISHISHDGITSSTNITSVDSQDSGVYIFDPHNSGEGLLKPGSVQHSRAVGKPLGANRTYNEEGLSPLLINQDLGVSCECARIMMEKITAESGGKYSEVFAQHQEINQPETAVAQKYVDIQHQTKTSLRSQPRRREPLTITETGKEETKETPHMKTIIVPKLHQRPRNTKGNLSSISDTLQGSADHEHIQSIRGTYSKQPHTRDKSTVTSVTKSGSSNKRQDTSIVKQVSSSKNVQPVHNSSCQLTKTSDGSQTTPNSANSYDSTPKSFRRQKMVKETPKPSSNDYNRKIYKPLESHRTDRKENLHRDTNKCITAQLEMQSCNRRNVGSQQSRMSTKSEHAYNGIVKLKDQMEPKAKYNAEGDLTANQAYEPHSPLSRSSDRLTGSLLTDHQYSQQMDHAVGSESGKFQLTNNYKQTASQHLESDFSVRHHELDLLGLRPQSKAPSTTADSSPEVDIESPHMKTIIVSKLRQPKNKPEAAFSSNVDTKDKSEDITLPQSSISNSSNSPQSRFRSALTYGRNRSSNYSNMDDSIRNQDSGSNGGLRSSHVSHERITYSDENSANTSADSPYLATRGTDSRNTVKTPVTRTSDEYYGEVGKQLGIAGDNEQDKLSFRNQDSDFSPGIRQVSLVERVTDQGRDHSQESTKNSKVNVIDGSTVGTNGRIEQNTRDTKGKESSCRQDLEAQSLPFILSDGGAGNHVSYQKGDHPCGPATGESRLTQDYEQKADQALENALVVKPHTQYSLESRPQLMEPSSNADPNRGTDTEPPQRKTIIASKLRQLKNKPRESVTSHLDTKHKFEDTENPSNTHSNSSKAPQTRVRSTITSLSSRSSVSGNNSLDDSILKAEPNTYDGRQRDIIHSLQDTGLEVSESENSTGRSPERWYSTVSRSESTLQAESGQSFTGWNSQDNGRNSQVVQGSVADFIAENTTPPQNTDRKDTRWMSAGSCVYVRDSINDRENAATRHSTRDDQSRVTVSTADSRVPPRNIKTGGTGQASADSHVDATNNIGGRANEDTRQTTIDDRGTVNRSTADSTVAPEDMSREDSGWTSADSRVYAGDSLSGRNSEATEHTTHNDQGRVTGSTSDDVVLPEDMNSAGTGRTLSGSLADAGISIVGMDKDATGHKTQGDQGRLSGSGADRRVPPEGMDRDDTGRTLAGQHADEKESINGRENETTGKATQDNQSRVSAADSGVPPAGTKREDTERLSAGSRIHAGDSINGRANGVARHTTQDNQGSVDGSTADSRLPPEDPSRDETGRMSADTHPNTGDSINVDGNEATEHRKQGDQGSMTGSTSDSTVLTEDTNSENTGRTSADSRVYAGDSVKGRDNKTTEHTMQNDRGRLTGSTSASRVPPEDLNRDSTGVMSAGSHVAEGDSINGRDKEAADQTTEDDQPRRSGSAAHSRVPPEDMKGEDTGRMSAGSRIHTGDSINGRDNVATGHAMQDDQGGVARSASDSRVLPEDMNGYGTGRMLAGPRVGARASTDDRNEDNTGSKTQDDQGRVPGSAADSRVLPEGMGREDTGRTMSGPHADAGGSISDRGKEATGPILQDDQSRVTVSTYDSKGPPEEINSEATGRTLVGSLFDEGDSLNSRDNEDTRETKKDNQGRVAGSVADSIEPPEEMYGYGTERILAGSHVDAGVVMNSKTGGGIPHRTEKTQGEVGGSRVEIRKPGETISSANTRRMSAGEDVGPSAAANTGENANTKKKSKEAKPKGSAEENDTEEDRALGEALGAAFARRLTDLIGNAVKRVNWDGRKAGYTKVKGKEDTNDDDSEDDSDQPVPPKVHDRKANKRGSASSLSSHKSKRSWWKDDKYRELRRKLDEAYKNKKKEKKLSKYIKGFADILDSASSSDMICQCDKKNKKQQYSPGFGSCCKCWKLLDPNISPPGTPSTSSVTLFPPPKSSHLRRCSCSKSLDSKSSTSATLPSTSSRVFPTSYNNHTCPCFNLWGYLCRNCKKQLYAKSSTRTSKAFQQACNNDTCPFLNQGRALKALPQTCNNDTCPSLNQGRASKGFPQTCNDDSCPSLNQGRASKAFPQTCNNDSCQFVKQGRAPKPLPLMWNNKTSPVVNPGPSGGCTCGNMLGPPSTAPSMKSNPSSKAFPVTCNNGTCPFRKPGRSGGCNCWKVEDPQASKTSTTKLTSCNIYTCPYLSCRRCQPALCVRCKSSISEQPRSVDDDGCKCSHGATKSLVSGKLKSSSHVRETGRSAKYYTDLLNKLREAKRLRKTTTGLSTWDCSCV